MDNHNNKQSQDNKLFQEQKERLNTYARFSGIVIQMFAIIGLGTFAGVKLDEFFPNDHKFYAIILSLSSVILALVFVIRRIIAGSKE
ncbi:AtpZ/AtpI family protein [Ichthyenterobacterium sp. W332]|uniref:AtpZ/AtpI family protein n=1 Tax=Microcosmobacter mediterraneus TaxID=3075607 RepID=A0ABU2YJ72_9FLAO|nr:AtpZ/AtpI family protein [Ichthyenterobacterium sp. W332]MDT0558087.1 AtpZ/AtpI family protein [Ichthyenterobacterium sp. W332]